MYGATVIDNSDGKIAQIDDLFIHPFYSDPKILNKGQYDSAMVRLVEPLALEPGVAEAKPLALDKENYAPGKVCVMASFGDTGVRSKRKRRGFQVLLSLFFLHRTKRRMQNHITLGSCQWQLSSDPCVGNTIKIYRKE
jgi:hypothetical protein